MWERALNRLKHKNGQMVLPPNLPHPLCLPTVLSCICTERQLCSFRSQIGPVEEAKIARDVHYGAQNLEKERKQILNRQFIDI